MRRDSALIFFLLLIGFAGVWIGGAGRYRGADAPLGSASASKSAEAEAPGTLCGYVRDERGPVAGARVRYQGASRAAVTDAQGRFLMPPSSFPSPRVVACKEGYFIAGTSLDRLPLAATLSALMPLV